MTSQGNTMVCKRQEVKISHRHMNFVSSKVKSSRHFGKKHPAVKNFRHCRSKRRSPGQPRHTARGPRKGKSPLKGDVEEGCLEVLPTLKEVLPPKDLYRLSSSLVSLLRTEKPPKCVEEIVLVLRDETPPCLLIVTDDAPAVRHLGNALARGLTSLLQSKIPYLICIVPVFLERQQLRKASSIMRETLSEVRPLVPYGRWMMMPNKKDSFVTALKKIQNL